MAAAGESFLFSLTLKNTGLAGTMNERDVRLILRHEATGEEWFVSLPEDPRTWLPEMGNWTVNAVVNLPGEMPVGAYQWFVHLADPAPSLRYRAPCSIQLANEGLWEPSTGYNSLLRTLSVTSGSGTLRIRVISYSNRSPLPSAATGFSMQGRMRYSKPGTEICPYGETECPQVCTVLCTWRTRRTPIAGMAWWIW